MSGRRTVAWGLLVGAGFALAAPGGAAAQPASLRTNRLQDVATTASVTLDRLSVKMLGVDRPWNPHICIGCDVNNGAPFHRSGRSRGR